MGYLNVAAWKVYADQGNPAALNFLAGVVMVEAVIVYAISASVQQLANSPKLMRAVGWISVAFLLLLAVVFFWQGTTHAIPLAKSAGHSAFLTGLLLSASNIMQVPFWTGWCLFLASGGFIGPRRSAVFAIAAAVGTFCGMWLIVLALDGIAAYWKPFGQLLLSGIMPVVFVAMALWQLRKLLRHRD